eukprot:TRINITY_DN525_c0_g2_i1.p1 TRINITY_DN525_c0_g2~~TRINITY_DN525_c0_g2_i1.p1  ORF type:complete len:1127 (+),score=260.43 TRINITY_DN525_c0_g2_i1:113-3493(+)
MAGQAMKLGLLVGAARGHVSWHKNDYDEPFVDEDFQHSLHTVHFVILALVIAGTVCTCALGVFAGVKHRLSLPWVLALVIWTALVGVGVGTWSITYLNTRIVIYTKARSLLLSSVQVGMDGLITALNAGVTKTNEVSEASLDAVQDARSPPALQLGLQILHFLSKRPPRSVSDEGPIDVTTTTESPVSPPVIPSASVSAIRRIYLSLRGGFIGVAIGEPPSLGDVGAACSGVPPGNASGSSGAPDDMYIYARLPPSTNTTFVHCLPVDTPESVMLRVGDMTCAAVAALGCAAVPSATAARCPATCPGASPGLAAARHCHGVVPEDERVVRIRSTSVEMLQMLVTEAGPPEVVMGESVPYAPLAHPWAQQTQPDGDTEVVGSSVMWTVGAPGCGLLMDAPVPGVGGLTVSEQVWSRGERLGAVGLDFSLRALNALAFPASARPTEDADVFALLGDGTVLGGTLWGDGNTTACGTLGPAAPVAASLPARCEVVGTAYEGLLVRLRKLVPQDHAGAPLAWYTALPRKDSLVTMQHGSLLIASAALHIEGGLDAAVVAVVPYGNIMDASDKASILALLHGVLVSMTCGVLLYRWVSSTLKPMAQLEEAMEQVALLKLDQCRKHEASEILEVWAMQVAFSKMLTNMKECRHYLPQSVLYSLPQPEVEARRGRRRSGTAGPNAAPLASPRPGAAAKGNRARTRETEPDAKGGARTPDGTAASNPPAALDVENGGSRAGAGGGHARDQVNGSARRAAVLAKPLMPGGMRCVTLSLVAINVRNFRLLVNQLHKLEDSIRKEKRDGKDERTPRAAGAAAGEDERASLIAVHSVYLETILRYLKPAKGILDEFVGDRVLCAFNSLIVCQDHAMRAAQCAYQVVRALNNDDRTSLQSKAARPNARGGTMEVHAAVHGSTALCGTIGSTELRRFTIVGDATRVVSGLLELGRAWGVDCLVDAAVLADVEAAFLYRKLVQVELPGGSTTLVSQLMDASGGWIHDNGNDPDDLPQWMSSASDSEAAHTDTSRVSSLREVYQHCSEAVEHVYHANYRAAAEAVAQTNVDDAHTQTLGLWIERCASRHPTVPPDPVPLLWCPAPHDEVPMEFPRLAVYPHDPYSPTVGSRPRLTLAGLVQRE